MATSRTSTMLSAAVDVGRDLAEAEAAHEAHRGPGRVVGAEHEGRVDDHHREPVGGEAERLELGLVLGVDVGDPEVADLERGRLVGGALAASRPRSRRRSRCGRRARPRPRAPPRRRSARRAGWRRRRPRGRRRAARSARRRGRRGRRPSIARRTARRSVTSPVARSNSSSPRWPRSEPRRASSAQLVAALGERAHEVRAEEAARAGDQGLAPFRLILERDLRGPATAELIRRPEWARAPAPPSSPTRPPICPTSWSPSTASTGSASTSPSTASSAARARSAPPSTTTSTSACAAATRARPPPSPRSATSSRSTSRCSPRAARSSRSTSRPGSRAPTTRRCRRASS